MKEKEQKKKVKKKGIEEDEKGEVGTEEKVQEKTEKEVVSQKEILDQIKCLPGYWVRRRTTHMCGLSS